MNDADMDLQALRDSIRDVLERELDSQRLHRLVDESALMDKALWGTAASLGWPALAVGEGHGGLGLGAPETAVLFEELGRSLAPLPALGGVLAARAIALGGSAEQQARWLPAIAAGEILCAISETTTKSAVSILRGDAGEIVLSGDAADLLQGAEADLLIVLAEDASGAPALVVVEPKADGVELIVERTVDRTRHLATARFAELKLPADRELAAASPETILAALTIEAALALASDSAGGAQAVFERTLDYLKTREQFGKPIGSFQALKHRCAEHKVALAASASVVAEAVRLQAEGAPSAPLMASLAKAYACEVYAKVAEDAVQLHGGIGFTWEHDCHLFLKRAKLNQALLGGTAAGLDHAADLLLAS